MSLLFPQGIPDSLLLSNIDKGQDRALNNVSDSAIGLNAHQVPLAVPGPDFLFPGNQRVQHYLDIPVKTVIGRESRDDVADGTPDIGRNEVNHLGGRGRESLNDQLVVHKDGTDTCAG